MRNLTEIAAMVVGIIVIILLIMWIGHDVRQCSANDGVLVRGVIGYECINQ